MATASGCSPRRIVSRPSGACAIVPRQVNAAVHVTQRARPGVFVAAIQVTSESPIGKRAMTRLPNSIVECSPIAGKNAPLLQPGQDWQASPEPVRRTAAPVITIR